MTRFAAILGLAVSVVALLVLWQANNRMSAAAETATIAGAQAAEAASDAKRAVQRVAEVELYTRLLEARMLLGRDGVGGVYTLDFVDDPARVQRARDLVSEALQIAPESSDALIHLALVNAASGDWKAARSVATAASQDKENAQAQEVLARILGQAVRGDAVPPKGTPEGDSPSLD